MRCSTASATMVGRELRQDHGTLFPKPVTPPISENRLEKIFGTTRSSSPEGYSTRTSKSVEENEEREWVEQDEPGVYITIRATASGGRELLTVRLTFLKMFCFSLYVMDL